MGGEELPDPMNPCLGDVFTVPSSLEASRGEALRGSRGEGRLQLEATRRDLSSVRGRAGLGGGHVPPPDVAVRADQVPVSRSPARQQRQHGRVRGRPFALPQWYLSVSIALIRPHSKMDLKQFIRL